VSERYRRSPHLICYWNGGQLVFENYAMRVRVAASPRTCEILHFFDRWRSVDEFVRHFPDASASSLSRALTGLIRLGLLDRSGAPLDRRAKALATWHEWEPAASFFHFSTKDGHNPIEPEDSVRKLQRRAQANPAPSAVKRYPRARQTSLPAPENRGELPRALLERRTWRQFSRRPIELGTLATLLGLTFGVQSWLDLRGIGRVGLKTSPSGGSRHPIEAYVMALRVNGLERGLYHYNAATHALELLGRRATPSQLVGYLNGQWWFKDASVLVMMTAVFARTQWKYPASRSSMPGTSVRPFVSSPRGLGSRHFARWRWPIRKSNAIWAWMA
jgi:hypothetical protein